MKTLKLTLVLMASGSLFGLGTAARAGVGAFTIQSGAFSANGDNVYQFISIRSYVQQHQLVV
jgi:hypothetical protein